MYNNGIFSYAIDLVHRTQLQLLCWQTRATRLEVSQVHQIWYHSIC